MAMDLKVDTNFSGSTCVSLIYTPTKLTTINVGDSRAVIGRQVNGGIKLKSKLILDIIFIHN